MQFKVIMVKQFSQSLLLSYLWIPNKTTNGLWGNWNSTELSSQVRARNVNGYEVFLSGWSQAVTGEENYLQSDEPRLIRIRSDYAFQVTFHPACRQGSAHTTYCLHKNSKSTNEGY
ncbi:hypothetical protein PsorP6_006770 [Peronosclerospora sorghi]|uniref:Uncharacterized protein n=1 Tax=Peronosclerospora sorghi TaxID=230839 RepID=A0ACC0W2L9_9STRA|nr:hypothetical protein PsorP6_006770 [Peronosclerospora sorghi]